MPVIEGAYLTLSGVIQPLEEGHKGGFSGAAEAHERKQLAGLQL